MPRMGTSQAEDPPPPDEMTRRVTRLTLDPEAQSHEEQQGRVLRSSRVRGQTVQHNGQGNAQRQQKESVEVHVHLNQGQQDQGRGRGSRKGRGNRGGKVANRRRAVPEEVDGDIFYDDDEEDQGLYVKDGRYGVWAKTGFQALSNFDLKIQAVVISYKHGIRGYALLATKVGDDAPIELFVPEPHIFITIKTEEWLRKARLETFWFCFASNRDWQQMMMKKIQMFETAGGPVLHMVENIGTQLQLAHEDPKNMSKRKTVLGPGLFFKSDGSLDPNPTHYLHPSLSINPRSKPVLRCLNIAPDPSKSLSKLIKAHLPGQLWNQTGTAAMFISHSNSDLIRLKTGQHPSTVLMGEKGVGKSCCVDLCQLYLCGSKEVDKLDPETKNITLKREASKTTFPKVLEDIYSLGKEESLVASVFDYATLITKDDDIQVKSPFIFTTNRLVRCERAGDREVIIKFVATDASPEEIKAAEARYQEAMAVDMVPIGANIAYAEYVNSVEFEEDLEYFIELEMRINCIKKRTARGYALKDCAVKYIFIQNKEAFDDLGIKWPEDYIHYLETAQRDVIRASHIELSRASPLCHRYLEGIVKMTEEWSLTERFRSLAVVSSNKHSSSSKCKIVIAARISEPRFKLVEGVSMEIIQRVSPEAGVVPRANCAAFLSRTEEYEEEIGLVRDVQCQAEAILFPASELNSSLLKLAGHLLKSEELESLADQDTPTAMSATHFNVNDTIGGNNLLREQGLDTEELEDYNDVSMLLVEVDPGHVMNSTDHEGTHTGLGFGDNISSVERIVDALIDSDRPAKTTQPITRQVNMTQQVINVTLISDQQKRIVQKFQCQGCHRNFGNVSALSRHKAHCSNTSAEKSLSTCSIRFECSRCKKTFASKGYLKQHQASSLLCKRIAEESIALALSETNSTSESLKCDYCEKEFLLKKGLQSHKNHCRALKSRSIVSHNPEHSARQTSDDSSSTTLNNKSKSSQLEGDQVEQCEAAVQSLSLEKSGTFQEPDSLDPLKCSYCNRRFKNKAGLTTHKKHCSLKPQQDETQSTNLTNKEPTGQNDMSLTLVEANQPSQTSKPAETSQRSDTSLPAQSSQPANASQSALASQTTQVSHRPETSQSVLTSQHPETSKTSQASHLPKTSQPATQLKCSLCPKICKNKGSLASHYKACVIRNNPGLQKSQRRLSKSLQLVTKELDDDRDRRLSTTLLVKQHRCTKCGDIFATPTSIKMHMLSHK